MLNRTSLLRCICSLVPSNQFVRSHVVRYALTDIVAEIKSRCTSPVLSPTGQPVTAAGVGVEFLPQKQTGGVTLFALALAGNWVQGLSAWTDLPADTAALLLIPALIRPAGLGA